MALRHRPSRPATPSSGSRPADKPRGMLVRAWEVFAENKLALAGLAFVVFILLFCFVGPHLYVTNQVNTNLTNYLCTPSRLAPARLRRPRLRRARPADGRRPDLARGRAWRRRSSRCFFGTLYGAISGFAGGFVDSLMMRIVDAGLSLPSLMVIIILSVIFHPTPTVIIFIIAVFYWFGVARLVRGETLALRNREYVQAVKVIGGRPLRSVLRHIVPNAIGTIIVQATFAVADSILTLSVLGFLTLGVAPPDDRLGIDALRRPDTTSRAATTGG